MSIPVTYQGRNYWLSGKNKNSNRPYAAVDLIGPNSTEYSIWMLVDTGADYIQFRENFAHQLGIPLSGPDAQSITCNYGDGSSSAEKLVSNVKVVIQGYTITTDAIFSSTGPNLLGRTAIIQAIDFGMDHRGWLYG